MSLKQQKLQDFPSPTDDVGRSLIHISTIHAKSILNDHCSGSEPALFRSVPFGGSKMTT